MLIVEGGDAEMTQQKNSRKGSAVWPMVLSWLSSLILALLAVFVMLFTTFGNVGYMQSCVKSSGYAQSAYDDMVQDFISYGAATGFDADVMTGFMSVDQVESDMQDAVAGLYAKTLTYYTRDNIAEAVYSAMERLRQTVALRWKAKPRRPWKPWLRLCVWSMPPTPRCRWSASCVPWCRNCKR